MIVHLHVCDKCDNVKAFSQSQVNDFDTIICNMLVNNHMRICGGTMKLIDITRNTFGHIILSKREE
jgi:hypothetical protein